MIRDRSSSCLGPSGYTSPENRFILKRVTVGSRSYRESVSTAQPVVIFSGCCWRPNMEGFGVLSVGAPLLDPVRQKLSSFVFADWATEDYIRSSSESKEIRAGTRTQVQPLSFSLHRTYSLPPHQDGQSLGEARRSPICKIQSPLIQPFSGDSLAHPPTRTNHFIPQAEATISLFLSDRQQSP